jgi:DNA polymerase I
MNTDKHNIFLIDGNSLCYRAYYAIPNLSTSKGDPTNAVYGVIVMLKKMLKDHSPERMAVVFDLPGKTARHIKYEKYKETRPSMPEELAHQMEKIKEVIAAYKIPVFQQQGYEADDVIATLARKAVKKGFHVTIVTADKDAFQLVTENVRVLSPRPSGDKVYDIDGVIEKFGVPPEKMVDLMALMGDPGDNVPGVKGIGKVTARDLVLEFGGLEELYANIEKVSSVSVKKKLEEGKDLAILSRDLVRLDQEVPMDDENLPGGMQEPDTARLREIYKEMEFTKLLKELEVPENLPVNVSIISSDKELKELFSGIRKTGSVSLRLDDDLRGFAASFSGSSVFYADLSRDSSFSRKALDELKEIAGSSEINKIGHDIKRDIRILSAAGAAFEPPYFDVMIADYLLDPSFGGYALDDIAMRRDIATFVKTGKKEKNEKKLGGMMDLDFPSDNTELCRICDISLRLFKPLEKELGEKELDELFFNVEMPLVRVLSDIESAGVGIDADYLKKGSERINAEIKDITLQAYELAGEKFNINSPKQIQKILFDKLDLPAGRKIKTGRSTDEETLERLSDLHELPKKILEHRRLSKLKSGYYDSILAFTDPKENVLHAKFNQAVTSTGRLSSSEPNLQNIPIRTEEGREIRKAFIPKKKDNVLVAADYSQVELRILAHLSGDARLEGAFREGKDVHIFTASLIFDCPINDVDDKMRSAAKTVNFGIMYGMGPFALARSLGITQEKAQEFISAYFDRYGMVKDFVSKTIASTREKGFVTTLFGRRRYLPEISSSNERVRAFAERAAVNTAVQGTAADIIKMAMIKCRENFSRGKADMIIQVHDELVFDVPKKEMVRALSEIKTIMEGVVKLSIPLEVNVEFGPNWCEMEAVDL